MNDLQTPTRPADEARQHAPAGRAAPDLRIASIAHLMGRTMSSSYKAINFSQKFALFDEQWQPKVIAELNNYQLKLVKLKGDFIWHNHKDTDEAFIVIDGFLRIDLRDGSVDVSAGEMFVVPKGIEHKPYAQNEVKVLLIEPRGVLNSGHEDSERTAENDIWV
jgi:mannose-6-phosphate isomerase-like protein (cupin superfamily)